MQIVTFKIYLDRAKSVRGLGVNAVTIYGKLHWGERKTISVCDNKRVTYNLLCLYVAAYPTPKEKTGELTHLHGSSSDPQQHKSVQYKWLA